jgi:hypothetical protein
MVEFAILAIVVTLLIAGGIELAAAAFSGQRASDASRAGVDAWLQAVGSAGVYGSEGPYADEFGFDWHIESSPLIENGGLGDHRDGFSRPYCDPDGPTPYDDGLPLDSVTRDGDRVYLFNPLPIDVSNCIGADGGDPNKTRIAALVERLPALNRAIYSLYQRRCGDASGNEISCADTDNVVATYLRLPGKLSLDDDQVYLAVLDGDPDSPTFQMPLGDSRPTFDVQCALPGTSDFGDCEDRVYPDEVDPSVCWDEDNGVPIACEVRVIVRYRNIFHALLQYPFVLWNDPLPPEALEQMDLGPVGSEIGVVGSEVARGNVRRLQRTFQGCWETVTVPPGPGMQGRRSTRACN